MVPNNPSDSWQDVKVYDWECVVYGQTEWSALKASLMRTAYFVDL